MPEHPDIDALLERAEQAATAGDLAAADALLRDVARIQEGAVGPLHPDLAKTFNNLAIIAEKTGHPGDAETFYRRAVAIASASLPPEHPMVVASRDNLESFCHARGLPIDVPTLLIPPRDTESRPEASIDEPTAVAERAAATGRSTRASDTADVLTATSSEPRFAPRSSPGDSQPIRTTVSPARNSHPTAWVAIAIAVLLIAVLLFVRPWSSRNTTTPAQPEVALPRQNDAPPASTTNQPAAPKAAPRGGNPGGDGSKPIPTDITLVAAELCRSFSASDRTWRCQRVDNPVAPGPIVLYTRLRSARSSTVVHRWYHGSALTQSVRLTIGANAAEGYRTYSRQTVKAGDWRIEVRSMDGTLLHERRFSVK